jgi:Yip1 domain
MAGRFASGQDFNLKKMGSRILRAAKLNGETFRELRDDPRAKAQSLLIVAIVSLCYGAGLSFLGLFIGGISFPEVFTITLTGLFSGILIALAWSATTFLIVTKLFQRTIGYWGLARPFFFAWAPGILFILMAAPIPIISEIVRAAMTAWISIANVSAVKNAAGVTTQQSLLTFIISTIFLIFIGTIVLSLIDFLVI